MLPVKDVLYCFNPVLAGPEILAPFELKKELCALHTNWLLEDLNCTCNPSCGQAAETAK
jgi:hypothetical protein